MGLAGSEDHTADAQLRACVDDAARIAATAPTGYRYEHPVDRLREVCLYFLGLGGGDYVPRTPVRGGVPARMGGFGILTDDVHLLFDPGPDCMLELGRCGIDAGDADGVIITHRHIDHFADWEFAVARMSGKGVPALQQGDPPRRGVLLASRPFLYGDPGDPPVAPDFYLRRLRRYEVMVPGTTEHEIKGCQVHARTAFHRETSATTVIPAPDILLGDYYIAYLSDGEYRPEIVDERKKQRYYRQPDVLIANIQTLHVGAQPDAPFTPNHLGLRGTIEAIRHLQPRIAVVRSWGLEALVSECDDGLRPAPWKVEVYQRYIEEATSCPVVIPGTSLVDLDSDGWGVRHLDPPLSCCNGPD